MNIRRVIRANRLLKEQGHDGDTLAALNELEALRSIARRSAAQLRKWSEWYGNADHAARGQLPLPPAGDVELAEDISAALGPNGRGERKTGAL